MKTPLELRHPLRTATGVAYVEFASPDLAAAAALFVHVLGFSPVDDEPCAGRLLVQQGDARVLLTDSRADPGVAVFTNRHGAGIRDVALVGTWSDDRLGSWGDVKHTVSAYEPSLTGQPAHNSVGVRAIDHVAVCLDRGQLDDAVASYCNSGFHLTLEEEVITPRSGMKSAVVEHADKRVVFTLLEGLGEAGTSQIDEFVAAHGGPGVAHVALLVDDIVRAVRALRDRGLEFLDAPSSYYDALRVGTAGNYADLGQLEPLGILVDHEAAGGRLLQIFSRPVTERGTFYLELVQRDGAVGFGSGNIRALFEAVELAQGRNESSGAAR